ncbi:MAG: crossover junction endodeoxyribonuclease RuvC [bacterium]|nr:crossover junction endodeoxyribonuclease RuvC [bacterium]
MIVLGVDPGLAITGFGIVESVDKKMKVLDYGSFTTQKKTPFPSRLKKIHDFLENVIKDFNPTSLAIEDIFFCRNVKTAINIGQVHGVVVLAAAKANLQVYKYTPLQIKQAVTGFGRAKKYQVQEMVKRLLGLEKLLDVDTSDALAVTICHIHSHRGFTEVR